MNKKIITTTTIAGILLLLLAVMPASAAIYATSVEIRGTLYNDSVGERTTYWDANNFAGFWYDLKGNLKSEELNITNTGVISGCYRTIDEGDLVYTTTRQLTNYKVYSEESKFVKDGLDSTGSVTDNGTHYAVVGWQAEKYIALKGDAKKLVKLVLEQGTSNTDKKTLTIGETWDIGDGWTLMAQSIDANSTPRHAHFVLSKDGVELADEVVETRNVFVYRKDIAGKNDAPLFVTYIDSVFAGPTSDMVQLKYTWAVSTDVSGIKNGDIYGVMEVTDVANDHITLKNKDTPITLDLDSTQDIMGGMKFKVADSYTLRFYPMVTCTRQGTYEVRGTLYNDAVGERTTYWDASNFAGFWYDLKNNLRSETLTITDAGVIAGTSRTIDEGDLAYTTVRQFKRYKVNSNEGKFVTDGINLTYGNGGTHYAVVGWQAEKYIALKGDAKKLVKLVLEQGSTDTKTMTIGETWDIGDGWTLTAQSIDAKATPIQAWLVLSKDGVKFKDKVISEGEVFTYRKDIAGKNDAPIFVTYVESVFAGATGMVQLKYTWAVSTDVLEIKSGDTFGVMEVKCACMDYITLKNEDTVTLDLDSTVDVMDELKFKVADSDTLRFYPFVECVIGEEPEPKPPYTDTDGDGVPDSWDLDNSTPAGYWTDSRGRGQMFGDMNGDGKYSSVDALIILQYAVGKI
ncbi:MAG: S-layer protein [Candidatus Argoarchaeum ethanivorans]|uniref:S-layer protein n=1 Tax=Candidatus Argoarchaeum ethanivorans TaxID=2608793 RepID=A0A811TJH1_9EURY|nr:MAG: S-layer protein [Candidatus Argoarchaeum ethanivorans]